MKSELGCYKGTKAQTFQNHSDAMTVMTQSTHMVVVFLLCHVAYRLNVSACTFDMKLQVYTNQHGLKFDSVILLCQVNLFYVF